MTCENCERLKEELSEAVKRNRCSRDNEENHITHGVAAWCLQCVGNLRMERDRLREMLGEAQWALVYLMEVEKGGTINYAFDLEDIEKIRTIKKNVSNLLEEAGPPHLGEMGFSVRVRHILKRFNIDSTEKLLSKTEVDLVQLPNMGKVSLDEVKQKLAEYGLKLKPSL